MVTETELWPSQVTVAGPSLVSAMTLTLHPLLNILNFPAFVYGKYVLKPFIYKMHFKEHQLRIIM